MSNFLPTVDIKNQCINNKEKIIQTLAKIEKVILHGLTHPKANHLKVKTFLDLSTNIFLWVANFAKSLIKTLYKAQLLLHAKVKIDGHSKNYPQTHCL